MKPCCHYRAHSKLNSSVPEFLLLVVAAHFIVGSTSHTVIILGYCQTIPLLFSRGMFLPQLVKEIHLYFKARFTGSNRIYSQSHEAVVPSQLHMPKLFSSIAD